MLASLVVPDQRYDTSHRHQNRSSDEHGKVSCSGLSRQFAAVLCARADVLRNRDSDGPAKIALAVDSLPEQETLKTQCEAMEIIHALIADGGRTELAVGTVTALAIGPAEDNAVDRITGAIPLLK